MSKLLEIRVTNQDWLSMGYDPDIDDFSDWCMEHMEQGMFIYNSSEEVFMMEQDFDTLPEDIREIADVSVFRNDGPTGSYGD